MTVNIKCFTRYSFLGKHHSHFLCKNIGIFLKFLQTHRDICECFSCGVAYNRRLPSGFRSATPWVHYVRFSLDYEPQIFRKECCQYSVIMGSFHVQSTSRLISVGFAKGPVMIDKPTSASVEHPGPLTHWVCLCLSPCPAGGNLLTHTSTLRASGQPGSWLWSSQECLPLMTVNNTAIMTCNSASFHHCSGFPPFANYWGSSHHACMKYGKCRHKQLQSTPVLHPS